jgi:hypothetical protein
MLPFSIWPDRIVADSVYKGTDLRIISSMRNPDNPQFGMAVYTAQTSEAMFNSNAVPHGKEDFVISDSKLHVLKSGYYNKTDNNWKFW